MRNNLQAAFESIVFVFGATERGYRLLSYFDGHVIIDSYEWRNWGDVALTAGQAWAEFAADHADELEACSAGYRGAIRASSPVDPADRANILELFIGSPEAASAQQLLDEIGSSGRAFERLSKLATVSNASAGMAFGAGVTVDDAMADFQRVLDEEGFGYIRLVRDDVFIRKV